MSSKKNKKTESTENELLTAEEQEIELMMLLEAEEKGTSEPELVFEAMAALAPTLEPEIASEPVLIVEPAPEPKSAPAKPAVEAKSKAEKPAPEPKVAEQVPVVEQPALVPIFKSAKMIRMEKYEADMRILHPKLGDKEIIELVKKHFR